MDTQEDFLSQYAGQGFESMTAKEMTSAYLSLVQDGSDVVEQGIEAGQWRCSSTGEVYGKEVKVVVLDFTTVWCEKDAVTGKTVARYAPNSIKVDTRLPPKNATNQFPKMFNPDTGNEIVELFMYAVTLADHPEVGTLLYNPPVGNMKVLKSWNKMMHSQIMPNGKRFPIFGYVWTLCCDSVKTKQGKKVWQLVSVKKETPITKELFTDALKPQIEAVKNVNMIALSAPEEEAEPEPSAEEPVPYDDAASIAEMAID